MFEWIAENVRTDAELNALQKKACALKNRAALATADKQKMQLHSDCETLRNQRECLRGENHKLDTEIESILRDIRMEEEAQEETHDHMDELAQRASLYADFKKACEARNESLQTLTEKLQTATAAQSAWTLAADEASIVDAGGGSVDTRGSDKVRDAVEVLQEHFLFQYHEELGRQESQALDKEAAEIVVGNEQNSARIDAQRVGAKALPLASFLSGAFRSSAETGSEETVQLQAMLDASGVFGVAPALVLAHLAESTVAAASGSEDVLGGIEEAAAAMTERGADQENKENREGRGSGNTSTVHDHEPSNNGTCNPSHAAHSDKLRLMVSRALLSSVHVPAIVSA
jgi:hypothetical protein